MKRILQVVGGMNRAGAETFLMNVYREIDKSKYQFDFLVYTDKKQDYEEEIISLGGRVIHMPCSAGWGMLKSVKKMKHILRDYGPYDAVHAHTLHNIAFVWLAVRQEPKIQRIAHSHNTQNDVQAGLIKRLYEKWSMKIVRKESQVCLACGEEAGSYLFGKDFSENGLVVNNGVEIDKYFNAEPISLKEQTKLNIGQDDLVIGNIARFSPVKNHKYMLSLAQSLKRKNIRFKMLLIGQGELKGEIENAVKEHNLQDNVFLLGLRKDIPQLLKTMDVFLMPSLFEGNPVTLVEAQASGAPCVISDTITEKIDMGLGLISRCSLKGDMEDWLAALQQAKGKRAKEEEIKQAFALKRYDIASVVKLLTGIYEGEDNDK